MERSGIVCLTGGAPSHPGVVVSAQNWLLEVRTKKTTAMDEHQPTTTTHHDLINLLLQDGLGEGLPKIAELLMNTCRNGGIASPGCSPSRVRRYGKGSTCWPY